MAAINLGPVQHIQRVQLPEEFYETQSKIIVALEIGQSALSTVDNVLNGSFDPMDNAIVSSIISTGQAMLLSIQTQVNNVKTSIVTMVTSIQATYQGTATGPAGVIAQVNSINSFITLVNNYITQINNVISLFNSIVNDINLLVSRFQNIQDEAQTRFTQAVQRGINDFIDNINEEKEPLSNSILNSISTQMQGLQNTAANVENITTNSWRQYVPPYSVDTYNPDPKEPDKDNLDFHGRAHLQKQARAFRGKILN